MLVLHAEAFLDLPVTDFKAKNRLGRVGDLSKKEGFLFELKRLTRLEVRDDLERGEVVRVDKVIGAQITAEFTAAQKALVLEKGLNSLLLSPELDNAGVREAKSFPNFRLKLRFSGYTEAFFSSENKAVLAKFLLNHPEVHFCCDNKNQSELGQKTERFFREVYKERLILRIKKVRFSRALFATIVAGLCILPMSALTLGPLALIATFFAVKAAEMQLATYCLGLPSDDRKQQFLMAGRAQAAYPAEKERGASWAQIILFRQCFHIGRKLAALEKLEKLSPEQSRLELSYAYECFADSEGNLRRKIRDPKMQAYYDNIDVIDALRTSRASCVIQRFLVSRKNQPQPSNEQEVNQDTPRAVAIKA